MMVARGHIKAVEAKIAVTILWVRLEYFADKSIGE